MYALTSARACKMLHATRVASHLSRMMTDELAVLENNFPGKNNMSLSTFTTRDNISRVHYRTFVYKSHSNQNLNIVKELSSQSSRSKMS